MTGLKFKQFTPIKIGNISIQAVQPQIGPLIENVSVPAAIGKSKIATFDADPIFQVNVLPNNNQFKELQIALPPIINVSLPQKVLLNLNNLKIAVKLNFAFKPLKLRGISDQRPEIVALIDYTPYFANDSGFDLSDTGDFIDVSIASRVLRFESIKDLITTLDNSKDADRILDSIGRNYLDQIAKARSSVNFMTSISEKVRNLKRSFDIRKDDFLVNSNLANEIVNARSYKDFLVEDFGFTEDGFNNFSNTKIFGQFLFDSLVSLRQYPSSLLGTDLAKNVLFNNLNLNFSLGEGGTETSSRNTDREFGRYFNEEIDITDGKFQFNISLLRNLDFSLLGSSFGQFLDLLPSDPDDRVKLLISVLSKEFRISRGLGDERTNDIIVSTFGGSDIGDPFDVIIGQPSNKITDPIIGENSLCSLLRFESNNQVILPFESLYVRDESQRLYVPGTQALIDPILEGTKPFTFTELTQYHQRFEKISRDAVTAISGLLDLEKTKRKLKPRHLFRDVLEDFIEGSEQILSNQGHIVGPQTIFPGNWGEIAILKAATADVELKHLLFQYVLVLGLIGKPSSEFGTTSVSNFFTQMANREITKYGDFPEIKKNQSLGETDAINSVIAAIGGTGEQLGNVFITQDIQNVETSDRNAGHAALGFLTTAIVDKIRSNTGNFGASEENLIYTKVLFTHLISASKLSIFNRIVDFISSLDIEAGLKTYFDNEGLRTRFNRLNYSTLALMCFETYMSFAEKYFDGVTEPAISLEGNINDDKFHFLADVDKVTNFVRRLKKVRRSGPVRPIFASDDAFFTSMYDIKRKLRDEGRQGRKIVNRIQRTTERINVAYGEAVDFFQLEDGPNSKKLADLLEGVDGKEKVSMINESQFVLARKALDGLESGEALVTISRNHPMPVQGAKVSRSRPGKRGGSKRGRRSRKGKRVLRYPRRHARRPAFMDRSVISENEKKVMRLVFNLPQFRPNLGSNLKILSVGIPAGFSTHFQNEIDVNSETFNSIADKEKDVININVYRKSIEYEDIVFKPIPYVFELSRFVSRASLDELELQAGFDANALAILGINFMKDFSRLAKGKDVNLSGLLASSDYSFLTDQQKIQLILNHLASYVLELYVKLTTGVSLDETEYLINQDLLTGMIDEDAKERFKDLIITYIEGVSGQAITIEQLKNASPQMEELLDKIDTFRLDTNFTEQIVPPILPGVSRSASVELTEDLINFLKLYTPKSLMTGGKSQAARIVSPKIFERIFNLAVDPDRFEIDIEKTVSTSSGKKMYALLEKRGLLESPTKLKSKKPNNNIQFDQFFVTISTIGDS